MSDSVQPHGEQLTRLLCPWDSPGKNTGVGCHFNSNYTALGELFMWIRASFIAQLGKNPPAMQVTLVLLLVGKIPWRRDRLPTPVFLSFSCGLAGKESACKEGDLVSIPGWKIPWRRERLSTPVFWPREFHGLQSMESRRVRHDRSTFTLYESRSFHFSKPQLPNLNY